MILADTSIWIDHLRNGNATLAELLRAGEILSHRFVTGEVALGSLRQRDTVLDGLAKLPQAMVASDREVLRFIDQHRLFGLGIGYIDVHLLAAVRLTPDTQLWTFDKRLRAAANRFSLHADLPFQ